MPVRSLNSSIWRWPSRDEVDDALRQWVTQHESALVEAIAVGYFGSYARNEAGVGSDLDVLMILRQSALPFTHRSQQWDFLSIPVPVEAQIYTAAEWAQLETNQPRFYATLLQEAVWLRSLSTPLANLGQ
ncbi:nucleotidyltransferase family protein [Halomicronema sp. CCY15110]|uniref:nucleotidyltransferase family protein n=1 Tax=Halomicronema sp. CCY15110 TaxID=2767773 RepID=UPI00194EC156|nr:nucleotidyltransferase domain-containing protein [Halomicronema sp. CCY15110]